MYLRIRFQTIQFVSFGVSMNMEIKLTPYIISGLVAVRYMRLPTNLLNRVGLTSDPSSSLLNFVLVATGVGTGFQLSILNLFGKSLAYLFWQIKFFFSTMFCYINEYNENLAYITPCFFIRLAITCISTKFRWHCLKVLDHGTFLM